jgi:O-antigen ligase
VQWDSSSIAALFAGTLFGILLGFVQVVTGSSWYIHEYTNVGAPVGFFANRNHMGSLLLMTLPFAVVLVAQNKGDVRRVTSVRILGVGLLAVILLSLAVNGSLAAIALSVPVILASALLLPGLSRYRAWLGGAALIALIGAIVFLAESPVRAKLTGENTSSFDTRAEIWSRTWSAIESSFPIGTGVGSFEAVYPMFELPHDVTSTYVNHAHNDYLEIILETGLAGTLLAIAFFVWWSACAIRILRSPVRDRFAGAAIIASAAVLAHSVVDYPLRTNAIAAVFALCLAFMARRPSTGLPTNGTQPARHLTIG